MESMPTPHDSLRRLLHEAFEAVKVSVPITVAILVGSPLGFSGQAYSQGLFEHRWKSFLGLCSTTSRLEETK